MRTKKCECIISVWVVILLFFSNVYVTYSETETTSEIITYTFSKSIFRDFVESPTLETIEKNYDDISITKYTYSKARYGYVSVTPGKLTEAEAKLYTVDSADIRIGGVPVYIEFFDYVGNFENFQQLLLENNREGKVLNCIIISQFYHPIFKIRPIVWVQTDAEDYFIDIDPNENRALSPSSEYVVQDYDEFKEKYMLKNGTLIINGRDITADNYIKFENKGIHLPFRAIMEELGAKITWVGGETDEIIIEHEDKKYILRLNDKEINGTITTVYDVQEDKDIPVWGRYGYLEYDMIDDRVVFNNDIMREFVYLIGYTFEIDYDNLSVNVIPLSSK